MSEVPVDGVPAITAAAPVAPVLRLEAITRRFGAIVANKGISLDLWPGEVLALLGENGAGKTTLMNILFGHDRADEGRVIAFGRVLPAGRPRAAIAAGIGMVHQHFALAANLSVLDNIVAGTEPLLRLRSNRRVARARLVVLAERFGLGVDPDARVATLSVGERQRVEILKALYRDARILILDEPTAVLTLAEAETLFATLRLMAAQGLSLIFISHKLPEVMRSADRIVVLRAGAVVAERAAAATSVDELAELMVGRRVARPVRAAQPAGAVVMEAQALSLARSGGTGLSTVDFVLRAGEILGIIGVAGNGQSSLVALACGLERPTSGRLILFGTPGPAATPERFVRMGLGRVPEDRHAQGAIGDMAVWENAILERLHDPRFARFAFVRRRAAKAFAAAVIAAFDVRGATPATRVRLLSGGNMQKMILGRALIDRPKILIAAQPTRGLDEGAVAALHAQILAARRDGLGVLLVSEDLDEVLGLADRVQAIAKGRLSPAVPTAALDARVLGRMMAGLWDRAA